MAESTALIPYDGNPTPEVQKIMQQIVADKSKAKYVNENVNLMLWLFDSDNLREETIYDWALERMVKADDQDREKSSGAGLQIRSECRTMLSVVTKVNKQSPIILDKLNFSIFSHYLTSRKSKKGKLLSQSSYGGIRSSLVYLYRMNGTEMDDAMKADLSQLMGGLKRHVTKERMENGESLDEGKKPMSFEAYALLCEKLHSSDSNDALFAHCFLTMEWNLMARSDNCKQMQISHVEWRQDWFQLVVR